MAGTKNKERAIKDIEGDDRMVVPEHRGAERAEDGPVARPAYITLSAHGCLLTSTKEQRQIHPSEQAVMSGQFFSQSFSYS